MLLLLIACFGVSEDPCAEYCDYVCDCFSASECDDCHAVYDDPDGAALDECEAGLSEAETCDTGG